ncbi:MAG TPA: PAS domain S-box protein [Mucilaginibacter sp.]|jgi:PAS domain S-box-containing protein|nr:PAS domain S-box protein [Mucilaginibacter sp.]
MEDIRELNERISQYENREKELEQMEARLRMAIDVTQLGTWEYYPLTSKLNWSEECKKIYGLPLNAEVNFEAFAEHIYPDDRDFVQKAIQKAMDPRGNNRYDITYRITRFDDDSTRWIRAHGKVYLNDQMQAELFMGTVLDITENKLAIEKLTRSEKLFKTIAVSIPKSIIIVIDKDSHVLALEGDIVEKMGFKGKDFEGKHLRDISPSERYNATKHLYERLLNGEKFSEERISANGEIYMVHFVPLRNEKGDVEAGLIVAIDISEIKQAEEKSAKLAAIVESSDDAIISKTFDSIITSWNDSAQRIFGYTAGEMIGESILKLIPSDRQDEEPQIISRLKKGERVEHFETKRVTKDGKLLDVSLTISPIKDTHGNVIGVSKIARDITEKKQEETRKNDFIAIVSHELKTPLTSMKSYIQVLLQKAKKAGDSFSINALARADMQAKKMTLMIQDFLTMAKLEDGRVPLHKEIFKLHSLADEVVSDAQILTSIHTVELKDCPDVKLNADREKIGQVLTNLVSNAIKYSPKGGNIVVGCQMLEGKKVKIYVRDEGVGISAEDQKRLFERFYRVKNEKLKTISGFGIGLYLVSEILSYHNSKIEVESAEGVGSTFYFILDIV